MNQGLVETALAREDLMLDCLCTAVKEFYSNNENIQAYEAWKKNKEDNHENNNNNGFNTGKHR